MTKLSNSNSNQQNKMATATAPAGQSDGAIHDHMARIKMRMLNERLSREKEKYRPGSGSSSDSDDALDHANVRLQQAMLRRDDLLGRLKRERNDPINTGKAATATGLPGGGGGVPQESYRPIIYQPVYTQNGEYRPNTYHGSRNYNNTRSHSQRTTPSPQRPPPSRRSMPDMPSHKQIVEHQYRPVQQVLPPIQMPVNPPNMYGQMPAVYTMPAGGGSSWNKGDFMEMMMMQNAQMHQMVMNQMMLSSLPTPAFTQRPAPRASDDGGGGGEKRAVHHHHYGGGGGGGGGYPPPVAAAPVISHITHLPPIDLRIRRPPPPPPMDRLPAEVEPLAQPRARVKPKLVSPIPSPQPPPSPIRSPKRKPIVRGEYPFPGSRGLRQLRHTFYAAFFTAALRDAIKKKKMYEVSDVFIFGIHLKEAVAALHRIYLNPDGKIYPILADMITSGAPDYSVLAEAPGKQTEKELYGDLTQILKNLIFNITEIMPTSGVLGTHRKAVVYELIKSGKKFPRGYFWNVEKTQIQFNAQERTVNLGDTEANLLLIGVFFSRAMVTTLLMKPLDYGLTKSKLDNTGQHNLMFLSTLIIMIVRIAAMPPGRQAMGLPQEISRFLYRDDDMKPVYTKLKPVLDEAVKYIREWSAEYIKKLRSVQKSDSRLNTPADGALSARSPRGQISVVRD